MDDGAHFLQPSTAHDVFSVKNSYLQLIDPVPDFLSAPVLYVPVHILTGSVQTDKQHAHKPINLLKINGIFVCRTAALTSRRYILNIYSTNIRTEYFKRAA